MSLHVASLQWRRQTAGFDYSEYNRDHEWAFASGVSVPASAALEYGGTAERVDPEEAFVASIAACHMLTFLAICARKRLVVDRYEDHAVGVLEKNDHGALSITRVTLSPRIEFGDETPAAETVRQIHEMSHRECFIANSIRTEVVVLDGNTPRPAE